MYPGQYQQGASWPPVTTDPAASGVGESLYLHTAASGNRRCVVPYDFRQPRSVRAWSAVFHRNHYGVILVDSSAFTRVQQKKSNSTCLIYNADEE